MDNKVIIEQPNREEIERASKQFAENLAWAQSLTKEQINFLCDGGWYNSTLEGYLILAAERAGFTKTQIKSLRSGLKDALSCYTKEDAEKEAERI